MSRSDAEPIFNDALGRSVRAALRRRVAAAAPSPEVWARIQQQAYAADVRVAPPRVPLASRARLRLASGRLLDFGLRTLRLLDEHTVSSEYIWRPESDNDLRQRLALQCISTLPLCGQMLASY